jgi:hypothetical protein
MARADMPGDWSDIPAPMTPEDMKRPITPTIRTCPKCGMQGAAFNCDERDCPVNGG